MCICSGLFRAARCFVDAQERQHPLLQCSLHTFHCQLMACLASKLLTPHAAQTCVLILKGCIRSAHLSSSSWVDGNQVSLACFLLSAYFGPKPVCRWQQHSLTSRAELTEVLVSARSWKFLLCCLCWAGTHHDSHKRLHSMSTAFRVRCHSSPVLMTERLCPCLTASRAKQKREHR